MNYCITRKYPLYFSIISQDVIYTRWLLKQGENPNNIPSRFKLRPLYYAVKAKNKKLIKVLLEYGADINEFSYLPGEYVVLHQSIDDIGITKLLLDYGSNPNTIDIKNGMNALHIAVKNGYYDVTKLLLSRGANVNIKAKLTGYTPIHLAAKYGKLEILKLLLEYNADIDIRTSIYGHTALHLAVRSNNESVMSIINYLILYHSDVNAINNHGKTALHYAIFNKSKAIIKLLLLNGGDINITDDFNRTILHKALLVVDKYYVVELLKLGGDLNVIDSFGETPFTVLIHRRGYISKIARLLVSHIVLTAYKNPKIKTSTGFEINIGTIHRITILNSYRLMAEIDIHYMHKVKLSEKYNLLDLLNYNTASTNRKLIYKFYNRDAILNFKKHFPSYYPFIKKDIKEAIERNFLVCSICTCIDSLIQPNQLFVSWYSLPIETKYMILSNLDNDSMRDLLEKYNKLYNEK
ncbi:ankyrin repeat family protein [Flamingopox virus FGPVKD09]|uniref:Ankyrin repeat family protein n=1 Tax=Flamingopox virus FGPVKD09 TaxID=2059380 RepID=A0A2H4X244_9POXV|nr:ankyrin repeat family protein [Flamingopox virus FGPVKD09]AUD40132.1 ankyrin repeat family protein [Flamingopox virus FGPVKD09]WCB86866.1 CPPV055 ankyrin repeat protein [Cooks petrelpox virus]